jgi:hypothetical protein
VISEMQNSPTAVYLSDCTSFHERVMICAVWKCVKREGINEIKWDDVRIMLRGFSLSKPLITLLNRWHTSMSCSFRRSRLSQKAQLVARPQQNYKVFSPPFWLLER